MRVVAVGAGDAGSEHPALHERADLEHFAVDLPIGMIQSGLEQRRHRAVEKRRGCGGALGDHLSPGVAGAAGIQHGAGTRCFRSSGDAGLFVHRPGAAIGGIEPGDQSVRDLGRQRRAGLLRLCPCDVAGAWAVAGLATDIHIGECRRIGVGSQVEVLAHVGRMTVGAHVVPGLVAAGPVQRVAGGQFLIGVEMVPAVPALILGTAVPGDAERLIASRSGI